MIGDDLDLLDKSLIALGQTALNNIARFLPQILLRAEVEETNAINILKTPPI
jgi:hypothetical protein